MADISNNKKKSAPVGNLLGASSGEIVCTFCKYKAQLNYLHSFFEMC